MHGLGARERKRIAELRENGAFFWTDVSLAETSSEQLGSMFEIPAAALGPLADFSAKTPPSRKFHVDGQRVVFAFTLLESLSRRQGGAWASHPDRGPRGGQR